MSWTNVPRRGPRRSCELLAVPVDRTEQAFFEIDARMEPEQIARLVDVGDAQLDVLMRPLDELDARRRRRQPHHLARQVVDRQRRARVADVESVADRFGFLE